MSTLKVEDRSRRGRSSSRSGRERSRSRSNVRVVEAPEVPRTGYANPPTTSSMPRSVGNGPTSSYEARPPQSSNGSYYPATTAPSQYAPPATSSQYMAPQNMPYPSDDGGFTMGGYTDFPPEERPGYVPTHGAYMPPYPRRDSDEDDLAYGSDSSKVSALHGRGREPPPRNPSYSSSAAQRYTPNSAVETRTQAQQYQYGQAPEQSKYNAKPKASQQATYVATPPEHHRPDVRYNSAPATRPYDPLPRTYSDGPYGDREATYKDITPGRGKSDFKPASTKTHRHSTADLPSPPPLGLAPQGLGPRMERLSVSGNRPDMLSLGVGGAVGGALPPPSPMLEAYHGTYQSISPMPLAIRPDDDLDLEDLPPLSPLPTRTTGSSRLDSDVSLRSSTHTTSSAKKRVIMYDPEEDARKIAAALSHHRSGKFDADAICDVLPHLSHDQIMEVRKEYKKQVRVQGKGVNMGKHINMKLTGNFGKAVYVCAMGKYESEGYWANFFYQSHGSRRELLIEALMGRTNAEIRMIRDEFKDKRYGDDLVKCMEKELKMDKFRSAVLMVLEARRQEEQDVYPAEYVHRDVDTLYRSINAERGGETAMLEIIVRRSDAHLREVLRRYEKTFGDNFARAALKRSNNLVGEVIAHILNGVINRPARDALLLQHAIRDIADKNRDDELRYELLISRLVRMHWDRMHLARVKREYYEKYRVTLEDAIEDATKGDFREFMCELCDVKGVR